MSNDNDDNKQVENKKESNRLSADGIDELNNALKNIKEKNENCRLFLLFTGSLINNRSWCPDCVNAKPIIENNLKYLDSENDIFVTVYVGSLPVWKNKNNVFRTDKRFKVTSVPTILLYGTQQRLVEAQCSKSNLVKMLFEGDE